MAPSVSIASWNNASSWSIGFLPTDDYIYLDDAHSSFATTLSYVQALDNNFTEAELQLYSSRMYVLGASSQGASGSSHTLTLDGNSSVAINLGLSASDSTTLSNAPNNSTFGGRVFYLGYYLANGNQTSGAVANISLSYTGLRYVTVYQSSSFNNFLDITSSIAGSGGIEKNGNGALILEKPTATTGQPSIYNTFAGDFRLDAGTVSIGQDTDIYNSNPSLRHGALGLGNVTIAGGLIGSADGSSHSIQNCVTIIGDFTTGSSVGGGIILSGNVGLGSATRTITVTVPTTISGNITSSGAGLGKSGTGSLLLSGNNSYGGATSINAGTVQLGSNTIKQPSFCKSDRLS
ncbi:MAG: autotransporter-associated beta strand repeat-containing protein [Phycisphaerae bacterium]